MAQITSGSLTIVDVTDGAPGLNNTTVFLYRRAVSAPDKPTGNLTYTFATASITGALEGWVQSIDELTGSNPIWMIAAVASSNGETDVIESSEWAGPIKMAQNGQDGLPGTPGTNGLNQATIFIYKRADSATAPSKTVYTFATGNFTAPSGWNKTIPTEPKGKPCWVTSAIAIGAEATAELNWVTPSVLVEDGTDGISPTVTATENGVKIVDAGGNETYITNGVDGTSYYTFVRYSKNANGSGYVVTPTSETIYIGVYTGTESSPPVYSDAGWKWSRYVGADGQPGTRGPTGPTGPQGVSVTATRELYYLKTNSTDPAQITNANQIHTTDDVNQWTSVVPTYIGSGKYYTCIETTLSNGNVVWSAPVENKGLTDANVNAANAIEIARGVKQHFFWVATDKSVNIPAGAYVAEESEESFYSNPTKGNILTRSDGIWIRNGVDKLATLQGSGLTFLVPTGTYKGQKSVSLNGSGLTFYNIGNSNSAAATLASDGLQITNGSIVLGITSGTDAGNVTLSNKNFTRSINGTSHSDLRFAIGGKFGVASDGTLYSAGLDSVSSSVRSLDGRVTTNEGNISANAEQIALRAKSSDVYTKNEVYTKTETSSAITAKANEITQSVSQTYQTKDAMSGYYTKSQTDSAITQKAGEISLSVAQTEISKIEVGGRNLCRGSNKIGSESNHVYGWVDNNYGTPELITFEGEECIHLQATCRNNSIPSIRCAQRILLEWGNVEYVISCDLRFDVETKVYSISVPVHYHNGYTNTYNAFDMTNANNGAGFGNTTLRPNDGTIIPANTWTHFEQHIVTRETGAGLYPTYRPFIYGEARTVAGNATVNLYLKNYKVEKGNKATTWTPAPEDIDAEISETKASITLTNNSITSLVEGNTTYTKPDGTTGTSAIGTAIKQTQDNILIKATKNDTTNIAAGKTIIESLINVNPDTVKIKAKNVEIDGTTTFNAIKTKTDAAYDAKNSASTVQTNLDNLKVGGRNLIWDSEWNDVVHKWGEWGSPTTREIVTINGERFLHLVTTAASFQGYSQNEYSRNRKDDIQDGDKIVVSFTAYAKTAGQMASIGVHWRNASGAIIDQSWFRTLLTTSAKRYSTPVWTVPNGTVAFNIMIGQADPTAQELWISHPMMEKATKASNWSPAPEDVQAEIDAKKSVHTLKSSSNGSTYANILTWTAEGRADTSWGIDTTATPIDEIKVGDTVRVAYKVTDMNSAYVYAVGTFERSSGSTVYLTMHGLDTTIIDGGNILTNSIGANKIKVNELTIGQTQVSGLSTALANTEKLYKHNVDLTSSSYNQDTWYPVLIGQCPETDASIYFKCSIVNGGGTPSWSVHTSKHWACEVEASYSVSRWGWKPDNNSYIDAYTFGQTSTKPIVLSNALSNTGYLVVYLRGGGYYPIQTSIADAPQIKTSSYTVNSQTVAPTTTQPVNTSNFVISRREGDTKTDEAATKATNYITHIDNNGIQIHPSGTTADRIQINGSAIQVYKNNSLRATFSDEVHIQTANGTYPKVGINATSAWLGTAATTFADMRTDGLNIVKGGTSVAFYGDEARIGKPDKSRIYITADNGMRVYDKNNKRRVWLDWDGFFIYDDSEVQMSAFTPSYVRIGKDTSGHSTIKSDGLHVWTGTESTATNEVAFFGATARIGKASVQRVEIASAAINMYSPDNQKRVAIDSSTGVVIGRSDKGHTSVNDNGLYIFDTNNKKRSQVDSSGLSVFDTDGSTNVATFGASARVGKTTDTNITITAASTDSGVKMNVKNSAGTSYVRIADIGFDNSQGYETDHNFPKGTWYTLGYRAGTTAQRGYYSLVAGFNCIASHNASVSTGINNKVYAPCGFAVGMENEVGDSSKTSQNSYTSNGIGNCSATIGYGLKTGNGVSQLVCGEYNQVDTNARFIVGGGGSASTRYNLFSVGANRIYHGTNTVPSTTSTSTSTGFYLGLKANRWLQLYSWSAVNTGSDGKRKDVLGDIDFAKELIMGLEPVEFQWKDSDHIRSHMGFIAQDAAKVGKALGKDLSFYEASYIDESKGDYHGEDVPDEELSWGMMYDELIAPLVKVVQMQQKEIDQLKQEVQNLKNK